MVFLCLARGSASAFHVNLQLALNLGCLIRARSQQRLLRQHNTRLLRQQQFPIRRRFSKALARGQTPPTPAQVPQHKMETKFYSPRAWQHDLTDSMSSATQDKEREYLRNTVALLLAPLFAAFFNSLLDSIIEWILLRNFPAWSYEWVCLKAWQGEREMKLVRWQNRFSLGVAGMVVLLRWVVKGWNLWEWVLLGLGVVVGVQMALVAGLLGLHGFVSLAMGLGEWSGWRREAEEWEMPMPTPTSMPESVVVEEQMSDHDAQGLRISLTGSSERHLDSPASHEEQDANSPPAPQSSSPQPESNTLTHLSPSSSWLAKHTLRLLPTSTPSWLFKGFRVHEFGNAAIGIETRYHSLSAIPQDQNKTLSFEEMRLQHYRQEQQVKEVVISRGAAKPSGDGTQGAKSSDDRSWLRIRDFGKSIFSNSTASTESRDTFAQSKLGRHGLVPLTESSSWSPTLAVPRESPRLRRSFL